jgi:hypothetical protein
MKIIENHKIIEAYVNKVKEAQEYALKIKKDAIL